MHKFSLVLALLLCLALVGTANAEMQVGSSLDFTLSKKVDVEGTEVKYHSENYGLVGAISPLDWLRLNVEAGTTTNSITLDTSFGDVDFKSSVGFNLGFDAEVDIKGIDIVDLSLIGGYKYSRTELDKIEAFGIEIVNPLKSCIQIHEWEIGLVVSKDLGFIKKSLSIIEPYVGAVYSDLSGDVETKLSPAFSLNTHLKAKNNFGVRCGVTTRPTKNITVSVDARFVDEIGIGGKVAYSF